MGRRRDRTRWSQVDLYPEKKAAGASCPHPETTSHSHPYEPERGRRRHKRPSFIAPRFAKNVTEASKEAECSIEELQDGYLKIRSKNLDIIFKKENYNKKMMEFQVQGITPNTKSQAKEVWNDYNLSKSSSIIAPDDPEGQEDPASVTAAAGSSFIDLDLDEIPEFRPRVSTVGSINDSGYSSSFQDSSLCYEQQCAPGYLPPPPHTPHFLPPPHLPTSLPPHPMCPFYLFSPATNTLIPCEEVMVAQTLESPGGQVFQGHTKAYVAYPVQGPDGRGYIMQPFSPPPELSKSPEREKSEEVVEKSFRGVLVKSCAPSKTEEKSGKESVDHVILPNVYIPGLPPADLKVKKKRRKKPKTKSVQVAKVDVHQSSSESESKEFEAVSYQQMAVSEELFEFASEEQEPINEIKLTDDLTNSLLNPPTEDDEIESSALAREILHLVDTDEDRTPEKEPPSVDENEAEELEPANAEYEAKVDLKSTEESVKNPKPKSTKPQTKQKQKKIKKKEKSIINVDAVSSLQTSGGSPPVVKLPDDSSELIPEAGQHSEELIATEVGAEEGELTTSAEGPSLALNDATVDVEEADLFPLPNVPEVRNKNKDGHGKRRRKRSSKEDRGSEPTVSKVMVDDSEVSIHHCRLSFGSSATNPDVIWIQELGLGMTRGVMELGRVFRGHYEPPERSEYAVAEAVEPVTEEGQ